MQVKTYAIYKDKEFDAEVRDDGTIILRSNEEVDPSLGFEFYKGIVYIKIVHKNEIREIFKKRFLARYKGLEFNAIIENKDSVQLYTMHGDYEVLEKLEFELVEKGVYRKNVNRIELDELREIKEIL